MELPDEVIAVGMTVGLHERGALRPKPCSVMQETELARAMPAHIRLKRTLHAFLAEWTPRAPCRRTPAEGDRLYEARIAALVRAAMDDVRAHVPATEPGEDAWRVATGHGLRLAGVFVRGRLHGGGTLFLVEGIA